MCFAKNSSFDQSSDVFFIIFQLETSLYTFSTCVCFVILKFDSVFGQELGLYKAQTKLPFNAFGTMAMARDVSMGI